MWGPLALKIGYIVHDLADAAVARRVRMLQRGGAEVALAGFHRTAAAPASVAGVAPLALGRTADGKLAARALSVLAARRDHARIAALLGPVDALVARNLEALAVASAVRRRLGRSVAPHSASVPLTYEILDIHRLLLGAKGLPLRALEGRLGADVSQVITSSPAFVEHYLTPLSKVRAPVLLVENKLEAPPAALAPRPAGPPWRIGLFGALRDRRSVATLAAVAGASGGSVEIDLRGKPSPAIFADLPALADSLPGVTFGGPYRLPDDLPALYGGVHFTWCIDEYEAGANSEWLLPNRLYEGCAHGAVPIARKGTAVAARLADLGIGHVLTGEPGAALAAFLAAMTPERYAAMAAAVAATDAAALVTSDAECAALVAAITGRAAPADTAEPARQEAA
ncbi:succinoglycan biosynthesis protein [Stappia sp. 22II-S9-Z10]|nr:succinoglycan biosynthesis protein [Stappia sp. 22II-S9-Z10]